MPLPTAIIFATSSLALALSGCASSSPTRLMAQPATAAATSEPPSSSASAAPTPSYTVEHSAPEPADPELDSSPSCGTGKAISIDMRLMKQTGGYPSPRAAALAEKGGTPGFPAGNVRMTEVASAVPGWRMVHVYRGTLLVAGYDAEPGTDGTWQIHRVTRYCDDVPR